MGVEVAGRVVDDPLGAITRHVEEHERTIRNYDLHEQQDPNRITARDVLATQFTKLRVDGMQLQHFVDRGRNAPWSDVPVGARLADADPVEEGGLYDRAEGFYQHFFKGRRQGLSAGKIHRVLHLKRPALFPLLDGRLLELFKDRASEASRTLRDRGRRGKRGRLYWVAIRDDVVAAGSLWEELRTELAGMPQPAALAAQLSDVRLHDLLCWELVRRR